MADDETNETTPQATPLRDTKTTKEPEAVEGNTKKTPKIDKSSKTYLLLCTLVVILGIVLGTLNKENVSTRPKYWVYAHTKNAEVNDEKNLLGNVHTVLRRLGYEKTTNETPWNLLWAHDYPFTVLYPHLSNLQPHQKVNHFPGSGYITNKVDLATTKSKYIPKAFRLPKSQDEFLEYASENKDALFLVKNNQHRGVVLKNVSEINLDDAEAFIQEFMPNPFLVDGYKFDIGVYVVLTSVDPLRIYWYKGDVLFRYCPEPYRPFDPAHARLDQYVVADDYLPPWQVPSLARLYDTLGFSMRDAFDVYVRSKGIDPALIWEEVQKAIVEVFLSKEKHIIDALKYYPSKENFFELIRVDLVVDEDLKVYLLEANMSPNLSASHFPKNRLLFEQVLYNLFQLVGVASPLAAYEPIDQSDNTTAPSMMSADKNIAVWGVECNSTCGGVCTDAGAGVCALCRGCVAPALRRSLLRAHTEHLHRGDFRRLFPPAMQPNSPPEDLNDLTPINKLQHLWYQGKCNMDTTWCI